MIDFKCELGIKMTLSAYVSSKPNILTFPDFPNDEIPYQKRATKNLPSTKLTVHNENTNRKNTIYIKDNALKNIGLTTEALLNLQESPQTLRDGPRNIATIRCLLAAATPCIPAKFLSFYQGHGLEIAQKIYALIVQKKQFQKKSNGIPGIYTTAHGQKMFLSLPNAKYLGVGSFGKVKEAYYINPQIGQSTIVAKKTLLTKDVAQTILLKDETAILSRLMNKPGIISPIASIITDGKSALFMPLYECSLDNAYKKGFGLTLNDLPSITAQVLQGLCAIHEIGTHGDIADRNILLERDPVTKGIKAVLADFGNFSSYEESGPNAATTLAPPEYFKDVRSPRQDIWALGLCMYQRCSQHGLSHWEKGEKAMQVWLADLKPNWVLQFPCKDGVDKDFIALLNDMLDPRMEMRPSAEEAFVRADAIAKELIEECKNGGK